MRHGFPLNNIAWLLRRFPIFAVPGSGDYRHQPVHVEDVADMAVRAAESDANVVFDAVGPEIYSYNDLVRLIARVVGSRARLVHLPPGLVLALAGVVGALVQDVVLTREEIDGLMAGLLVSNEPPTGTTRLSEWLAQHADSAGVQYASELRRHYRQALPYRSVAAPLRVRVPCGQALRCCTRTRRLKPAATFGAMFYR